MESQGAGLTLGYALAPALVLNANYSYNELLTKTFQAGTQSFFNTPTHKFNLGFDGQALDRALSHNLNHRWADAFRYESTFATGAVPVAQIVDAQVGYTLKALHTTLRAGAPNLFDAPNLPVYGAPQIGRIGYVGLLFDLR